jgi:hypothetical protein
MHQPISLAEIEAAKERIAGRVVRTPLVVRGWMAECVKTDDTRSDRL